MKLALDFVAVSDRGLVRTNNEDSAYAGPHLLVLADGMGGHAAGEVASQLMVEHLEHLDRDPHRGCPVEVPTRPTVRPRKSEAKPRSLEEPSTTVTARSASSRIAK